MTKAKFASLKSLSAGDPAQADDSQDARMRQLRLALIEGEESGDAEPGSFDRMRAMIRAVARRGA